MTKKQIQTDFKPIAVKELVDVLGITIKKDEANKVVTFLCQLSAYTENAQFNVSYNAPSSTGKSYIPTEIASLFPKEDVMELAYCSPTAFFHDVGKYDKEFNGYKIDLSRKILIFLDQPHNDLLARLRPLLSHDRKEINLKITDKSQKMGLRTKNVLIRGYPAVIFCTAGLHIDEQEATRFLLLSPEINQEKIRASIMASIQKESDRGLYDDFLANDPARAHLIHRIRAIRDEGIEEIKISNHENIERRFFEHRHILKPRHQRDIKRITSLIKCFTLLNLWWRDRDGSTITANQDDIAEAFCIWERIGVSQELNLPPYIYNLYTEVILAAWQEKAAAGRKAGLTRNDIAKKYYEVFEQMLDMTKFRQQILPMLTGAYSPPQILKMANDQWGLRTVKRKRSGGNPVSRSAIYKILNSIFYAGIIEYNGKQYPGKFSAMITLEEYDRVQFLLGKKGKSRPQKRHFAFTGMIRCGECGCIITAEIKKKHLKKTGEVREYTYYHCTLRKPQVNCSQRQVIREDELERQIAEEIQQFTILPEFKDWALEVLREENTHEVEDRTTVYESQQQALNQAQGKLDRLVDMRLNELLTDEQYAEKKTALEAEIKQFKTQMRSTENRADNWLETTELAFNFATKAHDAFVKEDLNTKKQILLALGSNQTLKDGKLAIEASPWLIPIKNDYEGLRQEFLRLEPADRPENKERMAHLRTIRSRWLRLLDFSSRASRSRCALIAADFACRSQALTFLRSSRSAKIRSSPVHLHAIKKPTSSDLLTMRAYHWLRLLDLNQRPSD